MPSQPYRSPMSVLLAVVLVGAACGGPGEDGCRRFAETVSACHGTPVDGEFVSQCRTSGNAAEADRLADFSCAELDGQVKAERQVSVGDILAVCAIAMSIASMCMTFM